MEEQDIRPAGPDDAARLAAVIRESFPGVAKRFGLTADNAPTHPANCQPDWIETALAKGVRYFVLERDGEPLGCVALERAEADKCYLERLAVLPQYRRQGLGAALVRHALAEARGWGASRVEIGIIAAQDELQVFYEKFGFEMIGTRDFAHLPFTVAFMGLDL